MLDPLASIGVNHESIKCHLNKLEVKGSSVQGEAPCVSKWAAVQSAYAPRFILPASIDCCIVMIPQTSLPSKRSHNTLFDAHGREGTTITHIQMRCLYRSSSLVSTPDIVTFILFDCSSVAGGGVSTGVVSCGVNENNLYSVHSQSLHWM